MQPIQPSNQPYYFKDVYHVVCDQEQKNKHTFKAGKGFNAEQQMFYGETGVEEYTLFIVSSEVKNHRLAHPNFGIITSATPNSQFKIGDGLLTNHFTFQDESFKPKIYFTKGETDYYKVINLDIIAGVVEGKLTPREGVMFCEPIIGDLIETSLFAGSEYHGKRRDIARVTEVWEGCTDYKAGDIIVLNKGADYYFDWEGKEYMKVDTYFDDVLGLSETEDIRILEERLHATHGETIQI